MKKNILFIIESSETGGAENVFAELVQRIDRECYVPHVALLYEGWLFDKLKAERICPHMIPTGNGGFDFRLLSGIFAAIRKYDIDLVHSHLFTTNVYASVCGAMTGIPVISTFHGTMDVNLCDSFNWIKWAIINKLSSRIVFVSNYLQNYFVGHKKANRANSQVIYNGIDIDRFRNGMGKAQARRTIGLSDNSFVIGCIGDLRPAKDYQSALQAVALLKEKIPNLKFVVAGTITNMIEELNELSDSLGIRNAVDFIGFRSDIENIMPSFDVYLSSSVSEGFSLSVVEAMAASIPVVATRSGGPEEIIIHGETGLLVEVASPEKLAAAIESIYRSRETAESFVMSGQSRVEKKFSVKAMVNNYENLFRELISGSL